jgi:DNA-binding YbaB/EbfC family protein
MFKNLTGLAQMLKSASSIGDRVKEMKERLAKQTATGRAGGDLVKVEVTGTGEVTKVRISPELISRNDVELIEELIPVAMNEALAKVRKMNIDMLREATGGISSPGLDEALSSL